MSCLALVLVSCATYQSKVEEARRLIDQGDIKTAIERLKPLALEPSDDQLIYLLDYATTLQVNGQFEESNQQFEKAYKLVDQLDYQSISRLTGSILLNEEMVQYKGDTFEKIFINAFMALNYLEIGQLDSALVEARRINEKYLFYRSSEKKKFELNPFAKYLSALIWEADKKWDDAFLSYKEAFELDPNIDGIQLDLIRSAKKANRNDEYEKYKKEFGLSSLSKEDLDPKLADIVFLFQRGWGPRKNFNPRNMRFPVLRSVPSQYNRGIVNVESVDPKVDIHFSGDTSSVYNVESAAIKTLEEDHASLVARRVGGVVAKEVAADQIRQKNELLGFIAAIALHSSDRADLRQWSFLPKDIQTLRLRVPPGTYKIQLGAKNSWDNSRYIQKGNDMTIKSGQTKFINWRIF